MTVLLQINLNIWGKNYFEGNDGTQNTLVFQEKEIYFRRKIKIGNGNTV